jgi:hypothetical protein
MNYNMEYCVESRGNLNQLHEIRLTLQLCVVKIIAEWVYNKNIELDQTNVC